MKGPPLARKSFALVRLESASGILLSFKNIFFQEDFFLSQFRFVERSRNENSFCAIGGYLTYKHLGLYVIDSKRNFPLYNAPAMWYTFW
jgi:hypothetical protein